MNQLAGFPILTLIVFIPVLGAVISLLVPPGRRETQYWLASLIAVVDLFISLFLYMGWVYDPAGDAQFVDGPWMIVKDLGVQYHLGIDGVNLYLVLLTTLVTPMAILSAWPQSQDPDAKSFAFWVLLLEAGLVGALTSLNLVLFVLFWLLAMLAMFFLIGRSAHGRRAARRFEVAVAIAAALMLVVTVGSQSVGPTYDPVESGSYLDWPAQALLFWCMMLALGISSAACPLHIWHPDAHGHAAFAVRLLLSSLFIHLGICGMIRFCVPAFPLAAVSFAPTLVIVGTVGAAYAGIAALGQRTPSGTLVYWNIAQVGLAVTGIFTLDQLGVHGAVLQMVARGLGTAALLLLLPSRTPSATHRSASAGDHLVLALGFLSVIGVPGLVGFVGQSTLVLGILRWRWQVSESALLNRTWDGVLYASIAFALLVGMWALLRTWRGVSASPTTRVPARQVSIAAPLLILIVLLGLRPVASSDVIGPTVYRMLQEARASASRGLLEMAPPAPEGEQEELPSEQNDRAARLAPRRPLDPAPQAYLSWPDLPKPCTFAGG